MPEIDFAPINKITEQIIACAIEVHKNLGPGFLESVYEEALHCALSLIFVEFNTNDRWKSILNTKPFDQRATTGFAS